MGWNDDGFDDWNFDDVKEDKKKSPIKQNQKPKWTPPVQKEEKKLATLQTVQ